MIVGAMLILAAIAAPGCGGSGGGISNVLGVASTQTVTDAAIANPGGPVTVGPLPLKLGTITAQ